MKFKASISQNRPAHRLPNLLLKLVSLAPRNLAKRRRGSKSPSNAKSKIALTEVTHLTSKENERARSSRSKPKTKL